MRKSAARVLQAAAQAVGGRSRTAATPAPAPAHVVALLASLQACSEVRTSSRTQSHTDKLRRLASQAGHAAAAEKSEAEPHLRWPLPIDVLAGHPELARAALADAAQAHAHREQEAQLPSGMVAPEPLEYRESTGSAAARLGGVVKKRPRSHRPPPPDPAPAERPVPLTTMSADQVAELMADAHARDVVIVDVSQRCDFADWMVIATGNSGGHVQAVAQAVHSKMKEERPHHLRENTGIASLPIEGRASSSWAVIDAGTMIVHVLTDDAREEYNLEGLWATHGAVRHVASRAPVQTLSTMRL